MAKRQPKEDKSEEKASIYLDADFIMEQNQQIVPSSPAVDSILCGGVPEGIIMLISGDEKLGKTTLALTIAANAQKMGKVVVYADIEHRLKKKNLKGIHDLDISPEKFRVIRSEKGNILSAEDILERLEQSLHEYPGSVVIVDSFSTLSPALEQSSTYKDKQMAARASLEAKFCRRSMPIICVNGNIIIGIAHVAQNITTPGKSENVGKKLQFAHDIKIKCRKTYKSVDKVDHEWFSKDEQIGHRVVWECPVNAIGRGGGSAIGYVNYGYGLDEAAEILNLSIEMGLIDVAGSWYTINSTQEKFQGWDAIYQIISENIELKDALYKNIKELTYESKES